MIAPLIRIALRYLSGVLIAKGIFGAEHASFFFDPEVEAAIITLAGLIIGGATEYTYVLARRYGWSK